MALKVRINHVARLLARVNRVDRLSARVKPFFPAQVFGGPGIAVTYTGGTYTFSFAIDALAEIPSIATGEQDNIFFPTYRNDTDPPYGRISLETLLGAIPGLAIGFNVQAWDADLDAIAALDTTAAGRSVLTAIDPNMDRVMAWDDSVGKIVPIALADIATDAAPGTGTYILTYGTGGALRKVSWENIPEGGGGGGGGGTFPTETYSGTATGDGVTDEFELPIELDDPELIEWYEGGVRQSPVGGTPAYTISGTTLTRTEPPADGVDIWWVIRGAPDLTPSVASVLDAAASVSGHRAVVYDAGRLRHADPTDPLDAFMALGVSTNAAIEDDPVTVVRSGIVEHAFGFDPGEPVFIGTDGALTQTPPEAPSYAFALQIGRALAADVLMVDPQPPLFLTEE